MKLNELKKIEGNRTPKKRVGRGGGSCKGFHTTGRGQKGQKSRVGYKLPQGFEGGQVPLYKRLPQLGGFKNSRSKKFSALDLSKLEVFADGQEVTSTLLVEKGILKTVAKDGVKLLGGGKFAKKLILKGFFASKSAKISLEKSGSTLQ